MTNIKIEKLSKPLGKSAQRIFFFNFLFDIFSSNMPKVVISEFQSKKK